MGALHDLLRHLQVESDKAIKEQDDVKLDAIPDDGYADGGEPYTDEELDIINN